MSGKNTYLIYRGEIRAMTSLGSSLIFTTVHDEAHETGVYFIDMETSTPHKARMPGGVAMERVGDRLYVAGTDGHIWSGGISSRELAASAHSFEPAPVALAALSEGRLAVAHGMSVSITSQKGIKVEQTLTLPERPVALAADPGGEWLVAGTDRGMLFVFSCEEREDFVQTASAKLHEGQISSLMFEPDELRVLSTGHDLKLLATHVRGQLEPEDRGGSGMHEKPITAMIHGLHERFYTTGMDSCVKAWPAGRNSRRPTTQANGVVRTSAMALVVYNERPHLALAGVDATLRLFAFDEEGKVAELVLTLRDAMAWAKHELARKDPKLREAALRKLASFNDTVSINLIAEHAQAEADLKLKVLATDLLGESKNPRAIKKLHELVRDGQERVRVAAFEGLRVLQGAHSLEPLKRALDVRRKDVGKLAVHALGELAKSDDQALDLLTHALDVDPGSVAFEALTVLEKHYGTKTPEAHLVALRSKRVDIRKAAIIRSFQLGLLGDMRIEAALRRLSSDAEADLRLNAFLISLLRRPLLAKALRSRDEVIHRQLFDIENYGKQFKEGKEPEPPTLQPTPLTSLREEDWSPLLEAMASRALDTCIRGAQGLATLHDTRAFGTLLQLSRERDDSARVQACRALEELGDPRSLKRLRMMLRDDSPAVRDAAFSALRKLEDDEPMEAARAGLDAQHEDVRKRGLQVLGKVLSLKKTAAPVREQGIELLGRTLNDNFQPVRSEAFKVALKLKVGGDTESALRFGNQSIYADVRLDVLVEVMAQFEEDWAWNMLLEFLEDPDASLRKEAFEYAIKKAKKARRSQSLTSALRSRYEDVRLMAVDELTQRKLEDVEDLLMIALDDEATAVRRRTVEALQRADAHNLLVRAMKSRHDDIRVRAAKSVASMGDKRALEVLTALATAEEPNKANEPGDHRLWLEHVEQSLDGIAELGEAEAREAITPLLDSKHANIRQAAVRALVWTSRQDALGTLREVVRHADGAVQKEAALGLAYHGDSSAAAMVFGSSASEDEKLLAALGLLEDAEDQLLSFLDKSSQIKSRAFLILLLIEFAENDGVPDKCLAALSSAHPGVRLMAARGIEAFTDRENFSAYVHDCFNSLLGTSRTSFAVDVATINRIALALAFGSVQVKIRAARLLELLHAESAEEFERRWGIYERRYGSELDAIQAAHAEGPASAPEGRFRRAWRKLKDSVTAAQGSQPQTPEAFRLALLQLVFGAYVGLSRERSSDTVRQGALRSMSGMATRDAAFRVEVERALLLALGDSNQDVRQLAFDALLELGFDAQLLSNEALSTSFADMGSRGLKLLAERGGAKAGEAMLKEVMLTKTDGLEQEAAKLLAESLDWTQVWVVGLGALSPGLRAQSRQGLVQSWEEQPKVRSALANALTSRFEDVRFAVAEELARKQPEGKVKADCMTVLLEMLQRSEHGLQNRAMGALQRLGDSSAAVHMLDRIDHDDEGSANADALLSAAASFRDGAIFERLLDYIDRDVRRWDAFRAALTISGYDQYIQDPEDERDDRDWMKDLHPLRDELLAQLLDIAYRLADARMLSSLIKPAARWSLTPGVVDPFLVPLASFSKEDVQLQAVEAIGWRLRKREGSPDVLRQVLRTGQPQAQFLAAEGLALAGHKDGLSVLQTAVNFMEDYDLRRRAVLALGELGDPQAVEQLLELVQDPEGYLRPAAAEALGHMAKTARADEIFKLLVELDQDDYDLAQGALTGLRFFGTREAWRAIRKRATSGSWWLRQHAAEQLGYNPDQANIDTLSRIITSGDEDDSDVIEAAAASLRKIYASEPLEADYILVQADESWLTAQEGMIERLMEQGDAGRLLAILPLIKEDNQDNFLQPLVTALLGRDPLPVDRVIDMLDSNEVRTATVAAQIVGRASALSKDDAKKVSSATTKAHTQWLEARRLALSGQFNGWQKFEDVTARYTLLIWAAGRHADISLLEQAAGVPDGPKAHEIRHAALLALSAPRFGAQSVPTFEAMLKSSDADLRALASVALKQLAPQRAIELLEQSMEDAPTFNRLITERGETVRDVLRKGSDSIHLQGVVLGHMANMQDVEGFAKTLKDDSLKDEVRLGAIEGLASIALPEIDDLLIQVGTNEDEDEDLRKAAWRALRRARRARKDRKDRSDNEVSA